jgi:signal transduction protein with GAF and PtsI domain
MRVMDSTGEEKLVAYLEHPNVTMMAPIQTRLAAIVCANGDEQAHVAIVSRELGLPCAVQVRLDGIEPGELDGRAVVLDADGTLSLDG